jgi:predicted amidohydrolase YtcJ
MLDKLIPDRPIALVSYDGHSVWVNSVTLEQAQIGKYTPNPDGGVIERDPENGEPSGTLRETAVNLVEKVIPDYLLEERKKALLAYQDMALQVGVTRSHDAMLEAHSIATFRELAEEGSLKMRFNGSLWMEPDLGISEQVASVIHERERNVHPYFQIKAAKIFVDGVIEGGTGFLLEPYEHRPDSRGELIWSPEALNELVAAVDAARVQIHFHVIGDGAARLTLDALEAALNKNGKWDSRHLITHLQLVAPEDVPRFKKLDVVGVPQPFWFTVGDYYRNLALPYLGKQRADRQYPMKSFLEAGIIMASSSDFPVTIPFDPLIGMQTGITRSERGVVPEEVLWPEEKVTLEQMIESFTFNGAYANFEENISGSLEAGKKADLVVLDRNLFEVPIKEIDKVKVLLTLVDGEIVYRDKDFDW